SGNDAGNGIAVDGSGNAYVTGQAASTNFPLQGAIQTSNKGSDDAIIAKLNATGTALSYCTYLGGSGADVSNGIVVEGSGNAYVTGETTSSNFPTTTGALQTSNAGGSDAFVVKINATGSSETYGTYLGGSGNDFGRAIAVDGSGNAYVTGDTASSS